MNYTQKNVLMLTVNIDFLQKTDVNECVNVDS